MVVLSFIFMPQCAEASHEGKVSGDSKRKGLQMSGKEETGRREHSSHSNERAEYNKGSLNWRKEQPFPLKRNIQSTEQTKKNGEK